MVSARAVLAARSCGLYLVDGYHIGDDLEYLFARHFDKQTERPLVAVEKGVEMCQRVLSRVV